VIPETPQGLTVSSPEPNSPLSGAIDDAYLRSRSRTSGTTMRKVLNEMANSLTSPPPVMYKRPIRQTVASLPSLVIPPYSTPMDVEGNAQLGEDDDTMDLVATPFVESEVEEEALIDAFDTGTGMRYSMAEFVTIPESESDEKEQPLLPSRFEQSKPPPKQYVDIGVQTDDTAPQSPGLHSPRLDACTKQESSPLLRKIMRKKEWKDEVDRMLNEVRFDLWKNQWAKAKGRDDRSLQPSPS
jgi:hypothetical protein